MYCPECHSEFIQGVESCPDCNVSLIDHLPEIKPLEEIIWKTLHQFPSKTHADMAAEILGKSQIPYYIKSEWFASAYQLTGPSALGATATIYVPEEDLKRALTTLENIID